jgi:hypothetical protein
MSLSPTLKSTIKIYRIMILPIILHGYETWSPNPREQSAEENIWTYEGGSDRKAERVHNLYSS